MATSVTPRNRGSSTSEGSAGRHQVDVVPKPLGERAEPERRPRTVERNDDDPARPWRGRARGDRRRIIWGVAVRRERLAVHDEQPLRDKRSAEPPLDARPKRDGVEGIASFERSDDGIRERLEDRRPRRGPRRRPDWPQDLRDATGVRRYDRQPGGQRLYRDDAERLARAGVDEEAGPRHRRRDPGAVDRRFERHDIADPKLGGECLPACLDRLVRRTPKEPQPDRRPAMMSRRDRAEEIVDALRRLSVPDEEQLICDTLVRLPGPKQLDRDGIREDRDLRGVGRKRVRSSPASISLTASTAWALARAPSYRARSAGVATIRSTNDACSVITSGQPRWSARMAAAAPSG